MDRGVPDSHVRPAEPHGKGRQYWSWHTWRRASVHHLVRAFPSFPENRVRDLLLASEDLLPGADLPNDPRTGEQHQGNSRAYSENNVRHEALPSRVTEGIPSPGKGYTPFFRRRVTRRTNPQLPLGHIVIVVIILIACVLVAQPYVHFESVPLIPLPSIKWPPTVNDQLGLPTPSRYPGVTPATAIPR